MKLTSTLPERPLFMHVLPLFDLLGLVIVFLIFGPTFMADAGIEVEQPTTTEQLRRFKDPTVVTIAAGADGALFLDGRPTTLQDLESELKALADTNDRAVGSTVLVKADKAVVVGVQARVIGIIREAGMKPAIAYRPVR